MRRPLPLLALAAGAFGIGTTEFVIMGLLPEVAQDLRVDIPSAGLIITGYAIGVVVGAPVLAILTARMPRKATLMGLMGLFVLGNLLCALAPSYGFLMAARVVTAFSHAAFFGIGAVVAADLVPRDERARAMALMFAGLTVANIMGVPGGTAIGQAFGWRAAFVAVAAIGAVAMLGIGLFLPRQAAKPGGDVLGEFRVLGKPQVLLGMAMSAVAAASLFSVFTYIAPILREVSGFSPGAVTMVLLAYGVGLTLGNVIGGRLADWRTLPSIIGLFTALMAVLVVFTVTSHFQVGAIVTMVVWGAVSFALVAPLQMRVVDAASEAPNLASTLNQGAFNIGCASGAFVGGIPIGLGLSYDGLPFVGAAVALVGLGLALIARQLDQRRAAAVAAC